MTLTEAKVQVKTHFEEKHSHLRAYYVDCEATEVQTFALDGVRLEQYHSGDELFMDGVAGERMTLRRDTVTKLACAICHTNLLTGSEAI